jgi:23S rRNA-/tRNA-specific pseudouridylate synthase
LAKDVDMAQALTASFANGDIAKVYVGISKKRPSKKKQGWVQGGMVRSRDKSWRLDRTTTTGSSTTNFAKTRFFSAPILCQEEKFTLLLFRPYTGKTHQIRVAAKAMGMPLWGDPIYKDGTAMATTGSTTGGMQPSRTYLHASGILIPPLLDNPNGIALWCSPPFDPVLDENEQALPNLMRKHCDIPEVLDAMERYQ